MDFSEPQDFFCTGVVAFGDAPDLRSCALSPQFGEHRPPSLYAVSALVIGPTEPQPGPVIEPLPTGGTILFPTAASAAAIADESAAQLVAPFARFNFAVISWCASEMRQFPAALVLRIEHSSAAEYWWPLVPSVIGVALAGHLPEFCGCGFA